MAATENSIEQTAEIPGHELRLEADTTEVRGDIFLRNDQARRVLRAARGMQGIVSVLRIDEAKNGHAEFLEDQTPGPFTPYQRDLLWTAATALGDVLESELENWE